MATRYLPLDPLFAQQWHLYNWGQDILGLPQDPGAYRNDINVTGVWTDYTGKGVTVGVEDDGFQGSHPDLAANYLADLSYNLMTDLPGAAVASHGTATMGLIVAAQNGQGGVGVAYDAQAIGYSSAGFAELPYNFIKAAAHMLADGVDVSSNSWGMESRTLFASAPLQTMFNNTAQTLVQIGRDGLGTVTVFSAGNGRAAFENTIFTPTGSSPYVISVAAANIDGTVTSYSTPGPGILVAAPGSGGAATGTAKDIASIVTTDLLGTPGFNREEDGDYTNVSGGSAGSVGFNGTSASAPIVAGVVALMLEANPLLGYRDVQEILAYSAKTPAEVATWSANSATDWNGGGRLYNNDLGFGLVDALAAVRLAETWQKQSTFANITKQTGSFTSGPLVLDSNTTRSLTLGFQEAVRVQHATLAIDIIMGAGADLADVSLTLSGPGGHTSTVFLDASLYPPFTSSALTQLTYTFDTLHNWGEISNSGQWTLTVNNANAAEVRLDASLVLLGDAAGAGETFIYTDDYARLGAAEADRAILGATTVGPHTLNAAAVTSDTTIDLSQHMATIAGVATTIGSSMVFASLVTGDGNDTLVGDAGDTTVFSGRGINTVDGGAGADTLWLLKGVGEYLQAGYGTEIVLYGAASQDILTGIEALKFADGTLTFGTDPMVNEVFYAFRNPDLFAAGVVADVHYADVGWREGLDPNAWFDTSAYLAKNPDVAAAGINPLVHYEQNGWWEGRDPSVNFDVSLYLAFNPDVAAAGMDPLLHYLQYGIVEGRQTSMVVDGAHLQGDFDATYYLLANSDVALAGVDAFTHYQQYGWMEGRRADAYFDTSFYLAQNADVAAAGINPLTHFETYGWHEGRNPSQDFDTSAYLAAYADVAAAGIDPLEHYLRYGLEEGRSSFAWDLV
ncbi:S8 family serine peptidase [Aquabacter spiritensis]|uniref:Proprotein convertase P-domain-containing protein n=1 Tax=Aquabacter spiritensis TaxID=933073 RepID=A0A4R3LXU2_9HYPH|nr:S8 family serine peptidase [Aquabacter spiritensis]TCT05491.1 proprotein convertase P-domain-containing protein [Aquabacter spiritensis]